MPTQSGLSAKSRSTFMIFQHPVVILQNRLPALNLLSAFSKPSKYSENIILFVIWKDETSDDGISPVPLPFSANDSSALIKWWSRIKTYHTSPYKAWG